MAAESSLERRFAKAVRRSGGMAFKFVSPGFDGMPDRLVVMPGGKAAFVEVKAAGERPRRLQAARHRMLEALGMRVFVLDGDGQIGGIIDAIRSA